MPVKTVSIDTNTCSLLHIPYDMTLINLVVKHAEEERSI